MTNDLHVYLGEVRYFTDQFAAIFSWALSDFCRQVWAWPSSLEMSLDTSGRKSSTLSVASNKRTHWRFPQVHPKEKKD